MTISTNTVGRTIKELMLNPNDVVGHINRDDLTWVVQPNGRLRDESGAYVDDVHLDDCYSRSTDDIFYIISRA